MFLSTTVNPYFSFSQVEIKSDKVLQARNQFLKTDLEFIIKESTQKAPGYNQFDTAQILLTIYFHDNDPGIIIPSNKRLRDVKDGKLAA